MRISGKYKLLEVIYIMHSNALKIGLQKVCK